MLLDDRFFLDKVCVYKKKKIFYNILYYLYNQKLFCLYRLSANLWNYDWTDFIKSYINRIVGARGMFLYFYRFFFWVTHFTVSKTFVYIRHSFFFRAVSGFIVKMEVCIYVYTSVALKCLEKFQPCIVQIWLTTKKKKKQF